MLSMTPQITFILMILLSPAISISHTEPPPIAHTTSATSKNADSYEETPFTLLDSLGNTAEPGHLGLLLYHGGTVCGNSFNETAADAICKYMGYTFATGWTSQVESFEIRYGLEIKVSDVQCSSADWNNCNFTEEHDCVHTQDLFLSCSHQLMHGESEKETTVFTLVDHNGDESEAYRGGLLLYRGGTVCSDTFDNMAANAICNNMGYTSVLDWEGGYFFPEVQDNLNINLGKVECSSADWETCSFSEEPNCDHSQDVFLACFGREETEDETDDNERYHFSLVDSEGNEIEEGEGLLLYRGGTVCDDSFNITAAEAICRYMEYSHSTGWTSGRDITTEFRERLAINLDDVECSSEDWNSCTFSEENDCSHYEDVFLSCSYGEDAEDATDFKLVDSEGNEIEEGEGLLLYRGGTVCDDSFNDTAAEAICRYMEFSHSTGWTSGRELTEFRYRLAINLDDVECSSEDWNSCTFSEENNCSHGEDVFLSCSYGDDAEDATDFKLVDSEGNEIEEGEGLLLYRGGTVCDDSFNDTAAEAICRYMEYSHSTGWTSEREITEFQVNLAINLDDVVCSSADWNSCTFSEENNCGHGEDVFLSCSYGDDAEGATDFKLVDSEGNEIEEGEGLLLYRGGTVCDDSFNDTSAEAICRYMEYSHSTGWTSGREITEFQENLATNLGDVVCGSPDWNSCTFSEEHDCGHGEDVFLSCSSGKDAEDASDFKLVDSEGNKIDEGEGLLLYRGGTVCDDSFDDRAAVAICKSMGYTQSSNWESGLKFSIQGQYSINLDEVRCSTTEWESCTYLAYAHNCDHVEDVFLTCENSVYWLAIGDRKIKMVLIYKYDP